MPEGRYSILPSAPELISRTLSGLRVRPHPTSFTPAVATRRHARYYMTPVSDRRGRLAWFKATLQRTPWLRHSLREEIRVQRAFGEYEKRYHPNFDSPSYIASHDNRHGFVWLLRKYWLGLFAGDMDKWFGVAPTFFRHVTAQKMAAVLADVRAMTPFMKRRIDMDVHDAGWYLLDFHYYRKHFFPDFLKDKRNPGWKLDDVDRLEEIIHKHRTFLSTHANSFTHGDFYPNNIMLRPGATRPVVLFDWELSHLNLPTFDAVMMYLQAWRKPTWQATFRTSTLRHMGNSKSMVTAWNLATVSLATRLAGFCFIRLNNSQPERYPKLPAAQRPTLERLFRMHLAHLQAAYTQLRKS